MVPAVKPVTASVLEVDAACGTRFHVDPEFLETSTL